MGLMETVTVDGVQLTRLQVELAMKKLNESNTPLKPGRYLSRAYGEVILVGAWLTVELDNAGHGIAGRLYCVCRNGDLVRLERKDLTPKEAL